MILARVAGSLVSTIHHESMTGRKLLVLDKLNQDGEPTGGYGWVNKRHNANNRFRYRRHPYRYRRY